MGAIFLEPQAFSTASERLVSTDFYRANHQSIFATMSALSEKGDPSDVVTVTTDLANKELLDQAGGVTYLTDLASSVTTADNIYYYIIIVVEKAVIHHFL